ncbi:MAG TPA: T9SS type A sorting domain-containing protein [Chitinophagaceae bacterium]|jgi:hypothetical protein
MKKIIAVLLLASQWTFCRSQTTEPSAFPNPLTADSAAAPVEGLQVSVKDNNKITLKWQASELLDESFFAVERSTNGTDFTAIGVLKNVAKGAFEFVDDAPIKGKAFYRIKTTSGQYYAYSMMVPATLSGDISCRFYPNPVDKALIIRSEGPLDVQIADKFGKPLISSRLPAGLKIVDVSSLEPGVYVITLFQKDSNRLVTEKLVKK